MSTLESLASTTIKVRLSDHDRRVVTPGTVLVVAGATGLCFTVTRLDDDGEHCYAEYVGDLPRE